ncbi:MAG: serine/threonine protein kinase [Paracoccaceae bacterium]|nr:MAG: serine/threonine protein kinase [Paracoccaceae bacterium]
MQPSIAADIFRPGDVLNNTYRIETVLGRGGTSEVYRARSEISGRLVAIKVLKAELAKDEAYLRLMTREEAIRDIRHSAVVRYSENHRTPEGHVYLVMDYVEGPTLDRLMAKGPVPADDLMVIAARVAEGLVVAHAARVVHRDLSPDNIILRGGDPAEAVIIDFGIAKDDTPGAETIVGNEFAGKYAYAAPEQLHGRTDQRSDIYALGATLLAAFRGRTPDLGSNPVEMLNIKTKAPDVTGVPEPLRGLIAALTQPDPAARPQTMADVLRRIDPTWQPPRNLSAHGPTTPPVKMATVVPPAEPPPRKSRAGMVLVLLLLAVAGGGGAAWWTGTLDRFMTPALPVASPYVLTMDKAADAPLRISGHAPDEATQAALTERAAATGGTAEVSLAQGAISEGWGVGVLAIAAAVEPLPEWQVAVTDNSARVSGTALNRAARDAVIAALAATPGPIVIEPDIGVRPTFLTDDVVAPIVAAHQDCGPLAHDPPPPTGWGEGARIVVTGRMATEAGRLKLFDALTAAIGERTALIDVEILNPTLCSIEAALPRAPSRGFKVIFGFGDRPDPNPAARYYVGENPVIDVVIPADVTDGNLWVAIVDVTGTVFHLLPNLNRPENDVASLRNGQAGEVTVRVAYSLDEAQGTPRMAFLVDDSIMGKSKIVVLHAPRQVFEVLRPMSESVASFASALAAQEDGPVSLFSVDSRILTTESARSAPAAP